MKTAVLNLLILDDKTIMAGPLSDYLNSRFGRRVAISTFFDADRCMRAMDNNSHVIILNYFINGKDKDNRYKNGLNTFNSIKKHNPSAEVTMITSNGDMTKATEEMQRGACEYIMHREQYLYDILQVLDSTVVVPLKKIVVLPLKSLVALPVRKITHYYSVKDYLMMFIVAFVSIGLLVFVGYLSAALFR